MVRAAFLSLCLVAAALPARAEPVDYTNTGNGLFSTCTSSGTFETALCIGFISGVTRGASLRRSNDPLFCMPDNVTVGQEQDIVVKYLRDRPEKRHLPAYLLIAMSLVASFPCKK